MSGLRLRHYPLDISKWGAEDFPRPSFLISKPKMGFVSYKVGISGGGVYQNPKVEVCPGDWAEDYLSEWDH